MKSRRQVVVILFLLALFPLFSDTTTSTTTTTTTSSTASAGTATSATATDTTHTPVPYGKDEFPPWQRDLRRAEIISFGALPFVTFMATIYYDVYRYYDHNQNEAYRPWPFQNSDTAVALSEQEQKNIVLISAGISIGVAIFDFSFHAIRREIRNRRAEKNNQLAPEPIRIEPVLDSTPDGTGETPAAVGGQTQ